MIEARLSAGLRLSSFVVHRTEEGVDGVDWGWMGWAGGGRRGRRTNPSRTGCWRRQTRVLRTEASLELRIIFTIDLRHTDSK